MKRFKNSAVLMLGLCLAASMCACSKSDSTEEETTKSETQATTTEATTAEEKAEEETEEPEEEYDSYAPDIERVEGTGETLLGFNDWYLERKPGRCLQYLDILYFRGRAVCSSVRIRQQLGTTIFRRRLRRRRIR